MAYGLVLEFSGIGREVYEAVNRRLEIDTSRAEGPWPEGLLFHAAGAKAGGWVVFEVWQTQQAQQEFMATRLAHALQAGGVTAPPERVEWLELAVHTTPAS